MEVNATCMCMCVCVGSILFDKIYCQAMEILHEGFDDVCDEVGVFAEEVG